MVQHIDGTSATERGSSADPTLASGIVGGQAGSPLSLLEITHELDSS